jgi:hypothetical protein
VIFWSPVPHKGSVMRTAPPKSQFLELCRCDFESLNIFAKKISFLRLPMAPHFFVLKLQDISGAPSAVTTGIGVGTHLLVYHLYKVDN